MNHACRKLGHALTILLLSSLALAQPAETSSAPPSPDATAAKITIGLVDSLGMTEEQVPHVEKVITQLIERQREMLRSYASEEEQVDQTSLRTLQEALQHAQQQAHDELADVLTEEQLAGFDEALQQQRTRAAGEAVVMRLQEPLSLTEEQTEQLAPIFAENIRARSQMMQEIRGQGRTFGATRGMRANMQELQTKLEDQLRPILTDEQMAGYLEIAEKTRSQMRERGSGKRRR
jgi:hypothetical protein